MIHDNNYQLRGTPTRGLDQKKDLNIMNGRTYNKIGGN